jgi:hypothetical protein
LDSLFLEINPWPSSPLAHLPAPTPKTHANPKQIIKEQGPCHTMALPFTLKKYLKAKEELWKLKYFNMQK